ncbi:MAG: hypothetical protein ABSD75_11780 [Terriglobales bacterium]|jgi:hypothetical protein
MDLRKWSKANADYGRSLLESGIRGARSGEAAFLNGKPLSPFLGDSLHSALMPAVLGACIGVLTSYSAYRQKSMSRALTFGLLGATVCLSAGLVWESRGLTASVTRSALRNIGKVRDEHWLANNPIDYA